jgi:hypothetical protein
MCSKTPRDNKMASKMTSQEFRERFAINEDNGSYKLTADGCMARHNQPREMDFISPRYNEWEIKQGDRRWDNAEWNTNARVKILMEAGHKPAPTQSLEEFVEEHKEMFGDAEIIVSLNGRRIQ